MNQPRSSLIENSATRRNSKPRANAKKNKQNADLKMNVINYQNYETLNILKNTEYYVQTDKRFVQDIKQIVRIRNKNALTNIENIMKSQLTDLQCDQIDYRARLHSKANNINSNTKLQYNQVPQQDQCKCGCNKARGNLIPIFVDQQNLNILGPGILLLFLYMRAITASLLIIICIYSLFSFITNLLGNSAVVTDVCKKDVFCNFKSRASDQNKQINSNFQQVQQWLGLAYCLLWILVLRYVKYAGIIKNKIIDSKLKSDSDFAIKIQKLPHGYYEEKQLIGMLQSSWEKIIKAIKKKQHKTQRQKLFLEYSQYNTGNPLKMKSIQIIYNMQFARSMRYQLQLQIDQINSLITEKDDKYLVTKINEYRKAKMRLKQTYQLLIDLRKKFLNDPQFRKGLSTTCCIIEFNSKKNREMLLQNYGTQKMSVLKQVKEFLKRSLFGGSSLFQFKGKTLAIERAPQPSDILWQNCQKRWQLGRVIAIYLATFAIILTSFGLMTGLNFLQDFLKKNPETASNSSLNTAMNYIMSIVMLAINKIMWFGLFYLLNIEYNHTLTDKIISQMNKVLFLSLVNIIVLPILSNYIVMGRGFVYGNDGLSGLAFDYHITGIVQAFTKIFDPMMIIKKVLITLRFTRYKLIRVLSPPTFKDFKKGVPEVNKFYQGEYFDVAQNYVIMTSAILHAVFFCQLQPFIIILVTIMMATFYFVNRIKLLRICKIPQMTDYLVFDTGMYFLGWVPIFYGAGAITLSFLQNRQNPDRQFKYIGAIICLIIGTFALINPGNLLNTFVKWSLPKLTCINLFELMGQNAQEDIDDQDDDESDSDFEIKNKQYDQNSEQEQQERKKQIEYQKQQQRSSNNRLEGYYKNSNAIDLLGFQQKLKENQVQKYSYQELKIFCESFFPKTEKLDEIEIADNIVKLFQNYNKQKRERRKSKMVEQNQMPNRGDQNQKKQQNPIAALFGGM